MEANSFFWFIIKFFFIICCYLLPIHVYYNYTKKYILVILDDFYVNFSMIFATRIRFMKRIRICQTYFNQK